ncbi:hypothetical protein [Persicirhabdus sediminis]|nr:hypothetical protein [Persicirhabdus sediminis]
MDFIAIPLSERSQHVTMLLNGYGPNNAEKTYREVMSVSGQTTDLDYHLYRTSQWDGISFLTLDKYLHSLIEIEK